MSSARVLASALLSLQQELGLLGNFFLLILMCGPQLARSMIPGCVLMQGAKLQYGHVPLYESGDNPNAKQFASLHAVQVRSPFLVSPHAARWNCTKETNLS